MVTPSDELVEARNRRIRVGSILLLALALLTQQLHRDCLPISRLSQLPSCRDRVLERLVVVESDGIDNCLLW